MTSSPDPALDVAVIGAGPSGLAAANAAADAGLTVAVLDLAERIGGQYYRHALGETASATPGPFHHGWSDFVALQRPFDAHRQAGRIRYCPRHAVWSIGRRDLGSLVVRVVQDERERRPRIVAARAVIVATGAHDRQLPFPGWTLPGVMAGGGAQALLKGSHVAPGRRAVVAGTGPFLLSVADGLLIAGVQVAEIVEANRPWRMATQPRALPGAGAKLGEALGYAARLARHRVPLRTRHAVIAAHGHDRLEAVTVARLDAGGEVVAGGERRVACDLLAVGYGFTPQIELGLAAGCATALDRDGSLVLAADPDGRTSVAGVYAAGETTGVGGAQLAIAEGSLCGIAAARDLGAHRAPDATDAVSLRRRRRALRGFAAALAEVHPTPRGWTGWLADDTLVCRCEEVSCAQVRAAVTELGAGDARTVKLLARPGMGWCQGRICGSAVATLTAQLRGRPVDEDDLVAMSRRVLGQPVPIGQLASLAEPPADRADEPPGDRPGDSLADHPTTRSQTPPVARPIHLPPRP